MKSNQPVTIFSACLYAEKKFLFELFQKKFLQIKKKDYLCGDFLKVRGVAQLASALAWGARGRKFESFHPDGENQSLTEKFVGL